MHKGELLNVTHVWEVAKRVNSDIGNRTLFVEKPGVDEKWPEWTTVFAMFINPSTSKVQFLETTLRYNHVAQQIVNIN